MKRILSLTKYEVIIIFLVVIALVIVISGWIWYGLQTQELEKEIYTTK